MNVLFASTKSFATIKMQLVSSIKFELKSKPFAIKRKIYL